MGRWESVPCCERCWIERNSSYDPDTDELVVRQPFRLTEPPLESCGFCGQPTILGIYVRAEVGT
jgi:hypothetical protein